MADTSSVLPATLAALTSRAPDPHRARTTLDRLFEGRPELADRLIDDDELAWAVVTVSAASRFLGELLDTDEAAIEILASRTTRPLLSAETAEQLARWKQRELLRIASCDLLGDWGIGPDGLEQVGLELSDLAADVLDAACVLAGADGLAVIGMGKLGGRELNYASDIDIIFVGDGPADELTRMARRVVAIAASCFRVDTNLRPEGRDGALVRSLDSYEAYWSRWAAPWEFQALLKARPMAGDPTLATRFADAAQRRLWNHPFTTDDLRSVRTLKQRAESELRRGHGADRDLKRAPGGIRDIEFSVQLLQLVHGGADAKLRGANTLMTLCELAEAGYVDQADAATLDAVYRLLRTVEHRLQLDNEEQVHSLPERNADLERLGRVMGRRDGVDGTAGELLDAELRRRRAEVRSIHERVYFRPLLEAFAGQGSPGGEGGRLSPEAAVDRLSAFGFTDAKRTQAAIRELTRGLNRTSRLMQQLLPLVLNWLSAAPDPDLGLLMLRNLLSTPERTAPVLDAFRESPEAARQLCVILGTSSLLGDIVSSNPDLVERLPDQGRLRTASAEALRANATKAIEWRSDLSSTVEGLRRWKNRNLFGIAVRDIQGIEAVEAIGRDLTALADATLDAALDALEPTIEFCVVALGRFGGLELSFGSDLDVLYVYEGSGPSAAEEAHRLATGLNRMVSGQTPAQRIFEIDTDLRPEGRQGALARSLEAYERYWDGYAQSWERMVMTRARPAAGQLGLGWRLLEATAPHVWSDGLSSTEVRDIRRIKARVERERIPPGEDPAFHLKLGRGSLADVEFTVQLNQLRHNIPEQNTIDALEQLERVEAVSAGDAEILRESYRFCERVRNRLFLVATGSSDSLPSNPDQLTRLARSLDTDAAGLRERYRRVTRRARRVTERLFYGTT